MAKGIKIVQPVGPAALVQSAHAAEKHGAQTIPEIIEIPHTLTSLDADSLKKNATRFLDNSPYAVKDLERKVRDVLNDYPMMLINGRQAKKASGWDRDRVVQLMIGELSMPRLERIHLLLCGEREPRSIVAVDNGASTYAHTSLTLAKLGSSVIVKEVDQACVRTQLRLMGDDLPAEIISRIEYRLTLSSINEPTPADVVYWTSPNPSMLHDGRSQPLLEPLRGGHYAKAAYLGRDVRPGGYLVIQSQDTRYHPRLFDSSKWEQVFFSKIGDPKYIHNLVLPSMYIGINNFFILQRVM
jgi:hypothetical protein